MSATFVYKALDPRGGQLAGEVTGESKAAVAAQLRMRGLTVVDVNEKKSAMTVEDILDRYRGLKAKNVTVMARQLATMVSSGLSLLRSLYVLEEQTESPKLKRAVIAVRQDVEAGLAFSQALAKHPRIFNDLFVSMVKAGETGGVLDDVLLSLASQIEKEVELRRQIKSAMTYPVVVVALVVLILGAMLLFVVPQFETIYKDLGGQLPLPTRILLGVSSAVRNYWYIVGLLAGIGAFLTSLVTRRGAADAEVVAATYRHRHSLVFVWTMLLLAGATLAAALWSVGEVRDLAQELWEAVDGWLGGSS